MQDGLDFPYGVEGLAGARAQQARVVEDGIESVVAKALLGFVRRLFAGLREQGEREVGVCTSEARANVRDQHIGLKNDERPRDAIRTRLPAAPSRRRPQGPIPGPTGTTP